MNVPEPTTDISTTTGYMTGDRTSVYRRSLLGTVGAGTVIALAGCLGEDDEVRTDGQNGEDTGDDDSDSTEETAALDEPTEFPEDESCTVCNMITEEYPEWNTQLVTESETRVYFCSAGCLSAYLADPEAFDGDDEQVENVWVTDYDSADLIDGTDAYYVRIDDPDHIDDPMNMNPTPFEERDGAETLIEDLNEELGAEYDPDEDVITFDEFDYDLGVYYRSNFLDEDESPDDEATDAPEEFDLVDGDGEEIDTWVTDHWHTAVSVEEGGSRSLFAENVVTDGETIEVTGEHWEIDAKIAEGAPEDVLSIDSHGDHIHIEGESGGLTEIIFEFYHHGEVALTTDAGPMTVEVGEDAENGHNGGDDGHDH